MRFRTIICLILCTLCTRLFAGPNGPDVFFNLSDFTSRPSLVRQFALYPVMIDATNSAGMILAVDRYATNTAAGMGFVISNVTCGAYRSEMNGPSLASYPSTNYFVFPCTNGFINAKNYVGVSTNSVVPSSQFAYTQAQSDGLYAHNGQFVHLAGDTMTGPLTNQQFQVTSNNNFNVNWPNLTTAFLLNQNAGSSSILLQGIDGSSGFSYSGVSDQLFLSLASGNSFWASHIGTSIYDQSNHIGLSLIAQPDGSTLAKFPSSTYLNQLGGKSNYFSGDIFSPHFWGDGSHLTGLPIGAPWATVVVAGTNAVVQTNSAAGTNAYTVSGVTDTNVVSILATNIAAYQALISTQGLGSAAFVSSNTFWVNSSNLVQQATNGLGSAAFVSSNTFWVNSSNLVQQATNGLGSAAFVSSNTFWVNSSNLVQQATNAVVKEIQGTNILSGGSTAGQILTATATGAGWSNAPAGGSGAPWATVVSSDTNATIRVITNTAAGTNNYALQVSDPLNLNQLNVTDFYPTNTHLAGMYWTTNLWPGPTNTFDVSKTIQTYQSFTACSLTNLQSVSNNFYFNDWLWLSNASSTSWVFVINLSGAVSNGLQTTSQLSVPSGGRAWVNLVGYGMLWTNFTCDILPGTVPANATTATYVTGNSVPLTNSFNSTNSIDTGLIDWGTVGETNEFFMDGGGFHITNTVNKGFANFNKSGQLSLGGTNASVEFATNSVLTGNGTATMDMAAERSALATNAAITISLANVPTATVRSSVLTLSNSLASGSTVLITLSGFSCLTNGVPTQTFYITNLTAKNQVAKLSVDCEPNITNAVLTHFYNP